MERVPDALILTIATLVVLLNVMAMTAVLRNYSRLRQRMFVFVINLIAVEIVVGLAYVIDVVIKLGGTRNSSHYDVIKLVFEGLKNSGIIASALSTAIVTYALHKRTTSMGRHHDNLTGDGGVLNLPAFDTMLRVLSIGQNTHQEPSNNSNNTTNKENNTGKNRRMTSSTTSRKSDREDGGRRKMPIITSLLLPRQSWMYVTNRGHSSSTSNQPYIGRHGNSVLSVRMTSLLLISVWTSFLVTWSSPIIHHYLQPTTSQRSNDSKVKFKSFSCKYSCIDPSSLSTHYDVINLSNNASVEAMGEWGGMSDERFCSTSCYFFPLSRIQIAISVVLVTIVWFTMLFSAIKLLWLRKHSSNVFVRCSALWRFIFLTSIFYICTLAPHVIICTVDLIGGLNMTSYRVLWGEKGRFYVEVSSCFLLFHCALLPSLYLIRLLGFRRLFFRV